MTQPGCIEWGGGVNNGGYGPHRRALEIEYGLAKGSLKNVISGKYWKGIE